MKPQQPAGPSPERC